MSQATLEPTPQAHIVGLTPEQDAEAVEHFQDVKAAQRSLQSHNYHVDKRRRETADYNQMIGHTDPMAAKGGPGGIALEVAEEIVEGIREAGKKRAVKNAGRAAMEHYEEHRAAYEEQAEIDAKDAGVRLNR